MGHALLQGIPKRYEFSCTNVPSWLNGRIYNEPGRAPLSCLYDFILLMCLHIYIQLVVNAYKTKTSSIWSAFGKTVTSHDTTFPMCYTLMQHRQKYVSHVRCVCVLGGFVYECVWTQFVLVSLIVQCAGICMYVESLIVSNEPWVLSILRIKFISTDTNEFLTCSGNLKVCVQYCPFYPKFIFINIWTEVVFWLMRKGGLDRGCVSTINCHVFAYIYTIYVQIYLHQEQFL